MSDIICSRAWYDEDYDGPDGWNIEHLWAYSDGTYTTCDSDGNHESFESEFEGEALEDEVSSYCKDAEQSWIDYAQDCAQTGEDPLGQFNVRQTVNKKENWVIWFTDWIGREEHGYAVIDGRHGSVKPGRTDIKSPHQFSKEVAEYLQLKKVGDRYCMEGVTLEDIRNSVGYVSNAQSVDGKRYMKLQITYDKPRNARDVAKDVKAAAKKSLEREVQNLTAVGKNI